MARPTKYKEEFCEVIIPMFKEGMSIHEICLELGIHYDTFNEWRKAKPAFSEAIKMGLAFSQGWWEKQGRKGLHKVQGGPEMNPTVWFMNMKNRFPNDWRDKKEVDQNANHNIVIVDDFGEDDEDLA